MQERDRLSEEKLLSLSDAITDKILHLDEFINSDTVLSFVSCRSEVRTRKIIEYSLELGKKVGVPRVEGEHLSFYRIYGFEDLEPGYFGVPEPRIEKQDGEFLKKLDPDGSFMIVPGLAFDRKLNRTGYGKGFYDRYFSMNREKHFIRCGIAFDIQMCESIETDPFDVSLDMIVTESEIIRAEMPDSFPSLVF